MSDPAVPESLPEIPRVPAEENPWRVPLLDVRPVTHGMVSTSQDPRAAANALSYRGDDGTGFIGQEPSIPRSIEATLLYRRDRLLADGALFVPSEMEHKWALYHHDGEILCVRSWQRRVYVAAQVEQEGDEVRIPQIHGAFSGPDEPPGMTARILDFLLRTHALRLPHPAPLPEGGEGNPQGAAIWCFSMFGNMADVATTHEVRASVPDKPLRTYSLLHIAVATGNAAGIEALVGSGIPVDLLGADGLPPLHWALAREGTAILELLVARGSAVDVRSAEGATTLMTGAQNGKREHLEWLLARGADPNARDHRGFTALHRASETGNRGLAEVLLAGGADPAIEAEGHTAASLAEGRGHRELVSLLQKR
jgi:ankyrin repeat protein